LMLRFCASEAYMASTDSSAITHACCLLCHYLLRMSHSRLGISNSSSSDG
jgi:hypothetical protein